MKLSEIKTLLASQKEIAFQLPNGSLVPRHFHVTEVGKVSKQFIDCGGTVRDEQFVNFQLWEADDYDHRLHPEKLVHIIEIAERTLGLEDTEIEVEYQGETIGKYSLGFENGNFQLMVKKTDCLAREGCVVPELATTADVKFDLTAGSSNACTPGGGCC